MKQKYECRLCGKTFIGATTNREEATKDIIALTLGVPYPNPMGASMHIIHHCDDRSIGLADFMGYVATEADRNNDQDDL